MSDEKADFETLVRHPGWLRLVNHAHEYWQEQIGRHIETAADDRDDLMALQKMRQVIAAKKAVEQLLAYPSERLRRMAGATAKLHEPPSVSRRGTL